MTFQPLPHVFPFRFADAVVASAGRAAGRVRAAVTADADASRGGPLAATLFAELIAQTALLLEGGNADLGRRGFLAAISDLVVSRPAVPGDVLDVDVSIAGRFGDSVKFDGRISDALGAEVARGSIVVRHGRAA
jgi:3-hydroxymyristoyl/3-hydroxydecanoyl-(acyl carrier protein) dehydratase